jgi:coproporphyrinogen III oxidase
MEKELCRGDLLPLCDGIEEPEISEHFREMAAYIGELQDRICADLSRFDDRPFSRERWDRPGGGGGLTRVSAEGTFIEKGGVNTAVVFGVLSEPAADRLEIPQQAFAACGISLVIHPRSPRIPAVHMNVRRFELANGDGWFGGGIDMTPFYPYAGDCVSFHRCLRDACERIRPCSYQTYKAECDRYFSLPHRNEMRGSGGVFFDYLRHDDETNLALVKSVGDSFLEAFIPIVERRLSETFTQDDREFQLMRRGRYVEFNLLYDRGTAFGLKTDGRVESIFMSLPPHVNFPYDWSPEPGSVHAEMEAFYQPRDWVNDSDG